MRDDKGCIYGSIGHMSGVVVHGHGHSRTLGFPTANVRVTDQMCNQCAAGTYHMNLVVLDNDRCMVFAGCGPRFPDRGVCEVYCMWSQDGMRVSHINIYDKQCIVYMLQRVRTNRFLAYQSANDIKRLFDYDVARRIHASGGYTVMVFGTFDGLHKGHHAYMQYARRWGDRVICVVATDKSVMHFKGRQPRNNIHTRIAHLREKGWADEVVQGSNTDPYATLHTYRPSVIVLGYDQKSYDMGLRERLQINNFSDTAIVRAPSHFPDRYKSSLLYHE